MFDFTQSNFMYRDFEDKQILRNLLRDCKTDEERENLLNEYQSVSIAAVVIGFILAIIFCGVITLLFGIIE